MKAILARLKRDRVQDGPDDSGFVLIMLGLLIVPIVAFAALAVDVSSWYNRATELQRSADSAALAGVVWMPDLATAKNNAAITLLGNGITGNDGVTATFDSGDTAGSIKVCVTDSSVPQYFGAVVGSSPSITRCATAKYNLPLKIGSPLNFFGGDPTNYPVIPGHPEVEAQPAIPNSPTPPNGDYRERPKNYHTSLPNHYWYYGGQYLGGCKAITSTSGSRVYGYVYWYDGTRSYGPTVQIQNTIMNYYWQNGNWRSYYATSLPDCLWDIPAVEYEPGVADSYQIRPDMSPYFWAAIEARGTDAYQGDRYSPACYGSNMGTGSSCSKSNPDHQSAGYYYTIDINSNSPTMIQIFDARFDKRSCQTCETGDTEWNNSDWTTHFELLAPDETPYDPTDNASVVASGTASCGGGQAGNNDNSGRWALDANHSTSNPSSFANTWRTLCTLPSPDITGTNDSPYILHVWATGTGYAANMYAIRAVATTDATDLDPTNYPNNALSTSEQPSLAAWNNMSINVAVQGGWATFFLAKVTELYAGKTLVLDLYDPAEGAKSLTINTPEGPVASCRVSARKLDNSATRPTQMLSPCKIDTDSTDNNGWLLEVKINIAQGYTCPDTVRPERVHDNRNGGFTGNGCWWSVSYETKSSDVHDNTTWGARIEGDPIRLVK